VLEVALVIAGGAVSLKVAVTDSAASTVTVQTPVVLVQEPDQPVKVYPVSGVAVRVTEVPVAKKALQTLPQLIPEGLLVIVPVPLPDLERTKGSNVPDCPPRTGHT